MYERFFICKDCKVSYSIEYKSELAAKNSRRTRCPKCQRVHELARKRKNGSQIDFQEPKTDNSTFEVLKNEQEFDVFTEIADFIPETKPEPQNPCSVSEDETAASSPDPEPTSKEPEDQTEAKEPIRQAYKTNLSSSILSAMGRRITILTGQKKEKDSLHDAIAYGRHYRKDLD